MIQLENEVLRVVLSPVGGTLRSLYGKENGIEYLWQGDEKYWTGQAPNLFPFIGRLLGQRYTLRGKAYDMPRHGFVSKSEMETEEEGPGTCVFLLRDSAATRAIYPCRFEFRIRYTLEGRLLRVRYEVKNRSEETMLFAVGGHPGFNVPLREGLRFEDYALTFPGDAGAKQVKFSDDVLTLEERPPFPLPGGVLPLAHTLFDGDAIVLAGTPRQVTLSTPKDPHGLRVTFPGMPYVGFWHMPHTDAPYVCIEPWSALPGRAGITEELTDMPDRTALSPCGVYVNEWTVEVW